MKKYYNNILFIFIYRILVLCLWFFLGLLLHSLIEYPILLFFIKDFKFYSLGLDYQQWQLLHIIFSLLIIVFSTVAGLYFGQVWYEFVYKIHHGNIRKLVSK